MKIPSKMDELTTYYLKRAKEYELVYQKPERQADLILVKDYLSRQFIHQSIIEIACGTGYWTEILSRNAKSILAIDINANVLEVAQHKNYARENVTFKKIDIYSLKDDPGNFEGLFGGFIWSHVKKENLENFL